MPTSVPGISSLKNRGQSPIFQRGFTLIELLVVLLIMGLFAGLVAAMAQPDDRVLLRAEAERLAQLLDLAAVEARLTGKPISWTAGAGAAGMEYRFWRWREDAGWSEAGNGPMSDSFRPRALRPGMTISALRIEAIRAPEMLRLEFSPNGSLAYDFQMSLGAARYAVASSPLGEVRIHAVP